MQIRTGGSSNSLNSVSVLSNALKMIVGKFNFNKWLGLQATGLPTNDETLKMT